MKCKHRIKRWSVLRLHRHFWKSWKTRLLQVQMYLVIGIEKWNDGQPVHRRFGGLNATFNNISVMSWRSALLVDETGVARENHQPDVSHWQTLSHNIVCSASRISGVKFELTQEFPLNIALYSFLYREWLSNNIKFAQSHLFTPRT